MSTLLHGDVSLKTLLTTPLRAAFEPLITGGLLLGLLYAPDHIRTILPANLRHLVDSQKVLGTLKLLITLGVLRRANKYVSRRSLDNWTKDPWRFGEEVVVVTGGASGIGAAIVRSLVETSACVISLDVFEPKEPLAAANVFYYKCDISKGEELHSVAAVIRKTHGEPTVLINNAGIHVSKPIFEESEEEVRRVFNVNTIAHWLTVREFAPAMAKANHGHIVTIASMASFVCYAGNVDYCATKASALAFHEGLAGELKWLYKAPNVRTTSVHPSWVRTPMLTDTLGDELGAFERKTPLLEPGAIADAVAKQLHSGSSGQLIIPSRYNYASGVRGWASWVQQVLRNGLNKNVGIWHDAAKTRKG